MSQLKRPSIRINADEIFARIEAGWKHVAYDPKADKVWLLTSPYRCLDTKADWFDITDGGPVRGNNSRRIRVKKTKDWVYVCEK